MKSFFILVLIAVVIGYPTYQLYYNSGESVNPRSAQLALAVVKYPKATSWQVSGQKNFCIDFLIKCNVPSEIHFLTSDTWGQIYGFYKYEMDRQGWATNSIVVTSTPGSIVFTNSQNCAAELSPSKTFLFGTIKSNPTFNFNITCPLPDEYEGL